MPLVDKMRRMVRERARPLPASVDIFGMLGDQEMYEWPSTFAKFMVTLDSDRTRFLDLIENGTNWKIRMIDFLSYAIREISELQGVRRRSSQEAGVHSRLLNFAVSILATVDIHDFVDIGKGGQDSRSGAARRARRVAGLQRRRKPKPVLEIEKTFLLLQSVDFLSESRRHAALTHLLFLIISKIKEDILSGSDRVESEFERISSPRWEHMLRLLVACRRHVLTPHRLRCFTLLVADGRFVDDDLTHSAAHLLESKAIAKVLSPTVQMAMLQDARNHTERQTIARIHKGLSLHRDLFLSLSAVIRHASDGYRPVHASTARGAAAVAREGGPFGRRRSKSRSRTAMSRSSRSRGGSLSRKKRVDKKSSLFWKKSRRPTRRKRRS